MHACIFQLEGEVFLNFQPFYTLFVIVPKAPSLTRKAVSRSNTLQGEESIIKQVTFCYLYVSLI